MKYSLGMQLWHLIKYTELTELRIKFRAKQ